MKLFDPPFSMQSASALAFEGKEDQSVRRYDQYGAKMRIVHCE